MWLAFVELGATFGWQAAVARADVSPLAWSGYAAIDPQPGTSASSCGPDPCRALRRRCVWP